MNLELLLTLFLWAADHLDDPKRTFIGLNVLKRWNVHHGATDLGLMTAKEIRDSLRKGTLDPFDKVSAEGSNIREDLIEVDEIFQESDADENSAPKPQSSVPLAQGSSAFAEQPHQFTQVQAIPPMSAQPQERASPYYAQAMNAANAARAVAAPMVHEVDENPRTNPPPQASPSWRTNDSLTTVGREEKDSKSTQKRYYLIDKAKVLGPLSALEIQSLFNRGGLNSKVKVQGIGGSKAIPIAQFIASFSEDRIKELTEDGKLNQKVGSPSSKVLNELARAANAQKIAKDRKNKTYLILGLTGFILGALILVIFDSSQNSRRGNGEAVDHEGKKTRPKLLQRPEEKEARDRSGDDDSESRSTRTRPTVNPPAQPKAKPAPIQEIREVKKVTKPSVKPSVPEPKPAPVVQEKRPTPPAAKPVVVQRPRPVQAPAPEPAPARKEGAIERALSSGGGVQTVGPLSFSMTALESCPSKCTLTLRDATGATIRAVFFKSAYYDQLKKSGGTAFLSGTVRREGSGASILIQDVR